MYECFDKILVPTDIVVQVSTGGFSDMTICQRCLPLAYPKTETASALWHPIFYNLVFGHKGKPLAGRPDPGHGNGTCHTKRNPKNWGNFAKIAINAASVYGFVLWECTVNKATDAPFTA